ncbi:MAG: phenylacetate--CoA ligase family protein [Bacteroidia bacterium]|nr:phenylacetate--CoA ligase family protein [Bacteroidia bacterium]NNF31525.1 phenylacetate--CoA ligase family protein [Flavobacteriaceae bacterium]MBT8275600.1 phenylacetate--CoA ligase family protein [Bacteroidia bacterium]NNJ82790.1 phenylacetate--CoA ligase family protein [Flavobacteriaceae bacterium]NNK54104.1 phenylacetate--CoA ligase family protein [Flavobacteriaceae bacterium]
MNLFELSLKLNGFPITEAKRALEDIKDIPENKFEEYVIRSRQDILFYHLNNNPFYKKFIADRNTVEWSQIPVMQKSDLQKPLKERLSHGFSEKKVYVNKTSGSSGHPFIFAKDRYCHALTWAEILDRFGWFGIDFHSSYQARFYGIPLDTIGYKKERFKDWLGKRYRFPIFDLSEAKLGQFLEHFRSKKFDHINGYTSSIVLFAKFLKSKNITLTDVCPTLKYCIVTSEMLYPDDKKLMENIFGVPVINEYGASELDLIAFTNAEGQFVLNSETLFVEIVDENDQPVPHGTQGRIVITSLYNKAHPMIRYDIGDTGSIEPGSGFKDPVLRELVGRTNDVALLPGGKTVPGLTFYYVTKSVIEDDGNVKEFVIEQADLDRFKIRYVSDRELTANETETIKNALYTYLENDLKLEFERKDILDRSKRGKLKQFTSLL